MARMELAAVSQAWSLGASSARWLVGRALAWEDWLTLGIAFATYAGVARSVESIAWADEVPSLVLVGFLGLLAGLLLARAAIPQVFSHLVAVVLGAAVAFWQTLSLVEGGSLGERIDAVYFRFTTYFDTVFSGGISNDSLPFTVMLVGLTWLASYLLAWSLFRWHNPWLGLIPGGVALFFIFAFLDESIVAAVFLYIFGAILLLMRTHLMSRIREWRQEGVAYPPFISLTFLHTAWVALALIVVAAVLPVTGAAPLMGAWQRLGEPFERLGVDALRLVGPLKTKKIIPLHDYTSILPFQGSIELSERQLLTVRLSQEPGEGGFLLLRGAVYDEYASGGWKAGPREDYRLPIWQEPASIEGPGLVEAQVEVAARSVVGTVLFTPGQPLGATIETTARLPKGFLKRWPMDFSQIEVLQPARRLERGQSYRVVGLLPQVEPARLQQRRLAPPWVQERYLQFPERLPERVVRLGQALAAAADNPYDKAKAIESYLRQYPIDYGVREAPPGQDAMDYFLFESKRGYFDYHASAMVVLLRAAGVPARLAVGFALDGGDFDRELGGYRIEEKNAYAWPEVYFPGYGWVAFNPTPDRGPLPATGESEAGAALPLHDLSGLKDVPMGLGGLLGDGGGAGSAASRTAADGGGPPLVLWALVGLAVVTVVAAAGGRYAWQRSLVALPFPQQVWEKTVRLASWAGLGPGAGQTPHEFAKHLAKRLPDVAYNIQSLAQAYNRSCYGRKPLPEQEKVRLRRLWSGLRNALLWQAVRARWPR